MYSPIRLCINTNSREKGILFDGRIITNSHIVYLQHLCLSFTKSSDHGVNLDRYTYYSNTTFLEYRFHSDGPKGTIEKCIRLTQVSVDPNVYNLAFGDLDLATGRINDASVTDNKDRDKILSTIAACVMNFCERYPGAMVVAQGSTSARTRLYQMRISANLDEIQRHFLVYGLYRGKWELFLRNRPYKAILAVRI